MGSLVEIYIFTLFQLHWLNNFEHDLNMITNDNYMTICKEMSVEYLKVDLQHLSWVT